MEDSNDGYDAYMSQEKLSEQKLKVLLKTEDWEHTCHDGCCHTYGTRIFINDKEVTSGYANEIDTIIEEVLKYLGHDVKRDFNRNVE